MHAKMEEVVGKTIELKAKDGFTLPPAQATARPSAVNLPSGETADFEFTPDRPGELALEVWSLPGVNLTLHGRLVFRVSPAARDSETSKASSSRARAFLTP